MIVTAHQVSFFGQMSNAQPINAIPPHSLLGSTVDSTYTAEWLYDTCVRSKFDITIVSCDRRTCDSSDILPTAQLLGT